jgi:2-polyprenyl-3-methyl-5-hydroxy-6-metoxy-1,4-benzoquinol methylase
MNFYESINKYYDNIFPLNEKQAEFVRGEFRNCKSKLVEVGCANGKLTNALSEYNIIGIDLEKSFIDAARSKYKRVSFERCNMLDITDLNSNFDGIFTFGNTLVHLSIDDIKIFINKAYGILNKGGKLLIQILNYDNILDNSIEELPLIDNEAITFIRSYSHGDRFIFNTTLKIKSEGQEVKNSIELTPIRKKELLGILEEAGFRKINVYGSFDKDKYSSRSLPLIVSCEK